MLKRAINLTIIALIAAIFGFSGVLRWTAPIAQSVFFVCLAVGIVSLLFSLFEEPAAPQTRKVRIETKPQILHR